MNVLLEILKWSQNRPLWQRDALRRLVQGGELSDQDTDSLAAVCRSAHGLAEQQETTPLAKEHIPDVAAGTNPVSLVSIFHHQGVNALAEDQTLSFSPQLTVVYGDNGAGKTGYIRILKSACRARGQEDILGNVVSGSSPLTPIIAIKYRVGSEAELREWTGVSGNEFISRVSVFDTQCAAVYLTEKTDVAFRPFGLDLFDKLVGACKNIRTKLETEQRALASNALTLIHPQIPEGTAVTKFLAGLSSLTKPDAVEALAVLSDEEEARFRLLEKSLLDLQANDPEKLIKQLTLRVGRLQALIQHLKEIETALSPDAVAAVFNVRTEGRRKSEEAKRLREATFPEGLLTGTGSEPWKTLWEAARQFSEESAYPEKGFPFVKDGARCVLCQQDLEHEAAHRLTQFQAFVASTTERELRKLREDFARLRKGFIELKATNGAVDETVKEIRIEYEALADSIDAFLASYEDRRKAVVAALSEQKDLAPDSSIVGPVVPKCEALLVEFEARIRALRTSANPETRKRMTAEAQELRARKLLGTHKQTVLDDIERRKKYAAYGVCIEETKTQAITQKSSSVTKIAVSQRLKQSFNDELVNLSFNHIEVELKELGGADGVFYHKLAFKRAPGVDLPKVVSEGEQRCLSIAAFFAELSTADDPSGIVFDDPVSSLDYQWRQAVARRLVQEAKTRQVIVFTHDVVFLLLLRQFAEELGVEQMDQHVRFLSKGAGVCTQELPWVAMPIKKKIGHLKSCWQAADKLFRNGHQDAYEKEAKHLYGLLREAWERGLEEVLLGGLVERYRPSIQTQQVAQIADITPDDCKAVEVAMTKCSACLTGHDQAAAARAPVPRPDELKADIETLEKWVKAIRDRRQ
jgi:energy-coupling factor transporter ATP-binding protein EcfA2